MSGDPVMSAEDLVRQLASLTVWGPGRLTEGVQPSDGFEDSHDSLMRLIESARQVRDRMEDQARKVSAYDLRCQAVELLEQAKAMDGLRHVMVAHEHEYGTTMYVGLFDSDTPSEEEAVQLLQSKFEPERDECLTIEAFNLQDLTGGQDEASSHESAASQAKPEVVNSRKMGSHPNDLESSEYSELLEINVNAAAQGWAIFDSHGLLEIQRDDEGGVFDSDEAAIVHVAVQAHANPDGLEARALEFLRATPQGFAGWAQACEIAAKHLVPVKNSKAFMHSDRWTHCFVGSKESHVRWLFSVYENKVIYAEVNVGYKWSPLSAAEFDDLTEALVSTEELPGRIDDFDEISLGGDLPEWLPQSFIAEVRATYSAESATEDSPAPQG